MALIDKLTNIADAIREKTGGADPLSLDAMVEAIDSIEAGGGSVASGIYMAKITPAEAVCPLDIVHNLDTKDILFALCFVADVGDAVLTDTTVVAKAWIDTNLLCRYGMTTMPVFSTVWKYNVANTRAENVITTNIGHWDYVTDENTFSFHRGTSGLFYTAGVTYTVIIMAASAFSAMEV